MKNVMKDIGRIWMKDYAVNAQFNARAVQVKKIMNALIVIMFISFIVLITIVGTYFSFWFLCESC